MRNLEVRLMRVPVTAGEFAVEPGEVPRLTNGGILCRARWLSAGPVRAGFPASTAMRPGDVVPALAVCEVLESRHDVFGVGQSVVLHCGMREMCASDGRDAVALHPGQSPASTALGLLGPPGKTAYFALTDLAAVGPGETVLVPSASSVTGAMAGQVAVLKGARAIGIDDSPDRCAWAVRHARFAACINPRAEDLSQRLWQLAPRGCDIVFDPAEALLENLLAGQHLAPGGRVVRLAAGAHTASPSGSTPGQGKVRILHFSPGAYEQRRSEFLRDAIAWYGAGRLVCREDIAEGIENAPAQLARALRGECFGNPLVKL